MSYAVYRSSGTHINSTDFGQIVLSDSVTLTDSKDVSEVFIDGLADVVTMTVGSA